MRRWGVGGRRTGEKEGGWQGPEGGRRKEVKIRPETGGRRKGRKRGREGKEEGKEEEGRRSVGWDEEGGRGSETLWSFPALSPGEGLDAPECVGRGGHPRGGEGGTQEGGRGRKGRRRRKEGGRKGRRGRDGGGADDVRRLCRK